MPKGLLFFCCACCVLILTIINLSIGPIISGKVGVDFDSNNNMLFRWGTVNCGFYQDIYDEYKKAHPEMTKEEKKYEFEWMIDCCKRKKGMHDMEYTAFIFDIVIGFVCSLMGLLHFLDVKKDFVEKTGLIGLCCGGVGFILTLVYAIFNGIVYTNYYDNYNRIVKRNGDGAFAELKGNEYESLYFDKKGNEHAFYAKYSDLIKKQYNYDKDLQDSYKKDEVKNCRVASPCIFTGDIDEYNSCQSSFSGIDIVDLCEDEKTFPAYSSGTPRYPYDGTNACKNLYAPIENEITNKDKSDRFLTALILSLFVCLANIGLALFGFLLFRTPGDF